MNKSGRGEFEQSWMEVFDVAKVRPSDQVWYQINATLANNEASGYKKSLLFFKLLAAASVVFAIGVGIYSGYLNLQNKSTETSIADSEPVEEIQNIPRDTKTPIVVDSESEKEDFKDNIVTDDASLPLFVAEIAEDENTLELSEINVLEISDQKELNKISDIAWNPDISEPGIRKYIRYMPDYLYLEEAEVIEEEEPAFWAGVNFSAGVFNPNVEYGASSRNFSPLSFLKGQADEAMGAGPPASDQPDDMEAVIADERLSNYEVAGYEQSDYQADQALAYSFNLGYRLGHKWMLESGIAYRYNKASTITYSYFSDPVNENRIPNTYALEYTTQDLNQVNYSTEGYKVYNTFEYLAVPLDVGYLLINGKFNMLLKTGVSTNIFLQNTIESQDVGFDQIQLDNSEETPFRDIYLNGKLSTQLTYTLFKRYHISLEPGYRFALNSMTTDISRFSSYPSSFMISTGIWYSF
ncbi:hypothetical protein ACFLU5_03640 [Bacteroidota bacterium]